MPPKKKAATKTAAPKRKRKEESDDEVSDAGGDYDVEFVEHDEASNKDKTVEEIYQKKSLLEQILLRPDTYVGSVHMQDDEEVWIWDDEAQRMKLKTVRYVPALYKIFDEILVNAADHAVRDSTLNKIKVVIDAEKNEISVWNNGAGIPVKIHSEHDIYVPTLIFGHLLTSSNFDDNQKRVTGGRNGYGAKLTNIFSTKFTVETVDSTEGKKFRQTWTKNMGNAEEPKITKSSAKEGYTEITFSPDLSKFGMTKLDDDIVSLLKKRVYDLAGTLKSGTAIYLNGKKITGMKTFKDYVKLYTVDKEIHYFEDGKRWKVAVTLSEGTMQQVSFVNSICTTKGGKHVEHIVKQVSEHLKKVLLKKNNSIKPAYIKNQLWVFVSAMIINPTFDSQAKETLTTSVKDFGSKCKLEEDFLKKVTKLASDAVLKYADFKSEKALNKKSGSKKSRLTGISKLDDANDAGGRNSEKCTLILTEGDSAKALAVGGLSVVGRDYYGVFPLKGKPLNVRDCKMDKVVKNEEISTLAKILGLKFDKDYSKADIKTLRYGSIMIMADQDHDGSHIKGLLINFIHKFWPGLLKVPGFLKEFITPIVKATNNRTKKTQTFFTIPEYESWKENLTDTKGWTIKYYKGLGTSTPAEAKDYFSNISVHQKKFKFDDDCEDKITTAFSKTLADKRKVWLNNHEEGTYIDHSKKEISYSDFIDRELVLFSKADCKRSIPSIVDGLKPGQRKILFSCFKRNLKKEIKVAQLAGYVSEQSAYHHGEDSLNGTIINMAQNYVGSNNLNLLYPSGMFGTRLQGGKDSASPRYIFTKLSDITRYIFPKADDAILEYLDDDGQSIEPKFYVPIIPMVLVNGSEGIGTAWSTSIETYNPVDIVEALKKLINGEEPEELNPWYKGFDGSIEHLGSTKWQTKGVIEKVDDTTLEISELPVRVWTQTYKEALEKMMTTGLIDDFRENHTDVTVSFTVEMTEKQMKDAEEQGLYEYFKLHKKFATSNMVLFTEEGGLKEYDSTTMIIKEFYKIRLEHYNKRKDHMLERLRRELEILSNKVRFILEVIEETLQVKKRKKSDILKELKKKGYKPFPKEKKIVAAGDVANEQDEEEEEETDKDVEKLTNEYNYLLSMPLWSLTLEKVKKLEKEKEEKNKEVEALEKTQVVDIWVQELDELLSQIDKVEEKEQKEVEMYLKKVQKERGKNGKIAKSKGYRATSRDRPAIIKVETSTTTKKRATTSKKTTVKKEDVKKEEDGDTSSVFTKEDSDEETKKTAKKTTKKAATKKTTGKQGTLSFKKKAEPNEDEEGEEEEEVEEVKPTKKAEKENVEEEKIEDLPLAERLKRRNAKAVIKEDSEEETPKKKAPAKQPAKKKRKASITDYFSPSKDGSDSEPESIKEDSEEEIEEIPRATRARSTRGKAKKKTDDEIMELSDSEEEEEQVDDEEADQSFTLDDEEE